MYVNEIVSIGKCKVKTKNKKTLFYYNCQYYHKIVKHGGYHVHRWQLGMSGGISPAYWQDFSQSSG